MDVPPSDVGARGVPVAAPTWNAIAVTAKPPYELVFIHDATRDGAPVFVDPSTRAVGGVPSFREITNPAFAAAWGEAAGVPKHLRLQGGSALAVLDVPGVRERWDEVVALTFEFRSGGPAPWGGLPHPRRLEALEFHVDDVGADAVRALADAGWLAGLRRFEVFFSRAGDAFAAALPGRLPRSLRELSLRGTRLTAEGVAALCEAPFDALATLDLGRNPLDDAALFALASSRHARTLERLFLDLAPVTAAGMRGAFGLGTFGRLRHLCMAGVCIDAGADEVAAGLLATLPLRSLDVSGCGIPDARLGAIRRSDLRAERGLRCDPEWYPAQMFCPCIAASGE